MMCLCFRRSTQQQQPPEVQQAAQHAAAPQSQLHTCPRDLQQQYKDLQQLQEPKQSPIEKTLLGCSSAYSSSLQHTLSGQLSLNRPIKFHPDSITSPTEQQANEKAGWELHSSLTCPQLGPVEDARIEFRELLGSGSFGKVFKAVWAGREVAVKVIEHTTKDLNEVQHEADLMLTLQSPHVVKAYHYATYVQKPDQASWAKVRRNRSFRQAAGRPTTYGSDNGRSTLESSSSSDRSAGALHSATSERISALLGPTPSSKQARSGAGSSTLDRQPGSSDLAATVDLLISEVQEQQQQQDPGDALACNMQGCQPPEAPTAAATATAAAAPDAVRRAETHLVLEYCDAGTLGAVAAAWAPEPGCYDAHMLERLVLLKDVASGLEALHNQHVVHADLNVRNVLVHTSEEAPFGVVAKLGDMGMSRHIKQQRTHRTTNTIGTLSHQPPEMLQNGYMSPASDIYAFGIMMWELYTSQPAFRKLHYGQFFEAVVLHNLRPMVPQGMPADYQLLMESCWAKAPTDRPSITRVQDCLNAMIEERAVQAAAKEAAAEAAATAAGPDGVSVCTAAEPTAADHSSDNAAAAVAAKSKVRRNSLLALIAQREPSTTYQLRSSSNSFVFRSGGSMSAAAAAVCRSCNSDPQPPALVVGRSSCSITAQHHSGSYGVRQPSDTWLLQRSPASFSSSFNAPGCFFPSAYSHLGVQPGQAAPMMLTDAFEEDVFAADGATGDDGADEMGDIGIEIAAATADDYFWVV